MPEPYGPALAAWIDTLRGEQSVRSFASERGLDDARIAAWRTGQTPRMEQLRQVADALGVHLGDVLVAAHLADPSELVVSAPRSEPPPPGIDEAIERDPDLSDGEREILRAARKVARDAVRGRNARTRVQVPRSRRRKSDG